MTAKRALVVDDSRSARISLQRLLEQYHIAVDFAESGEEALDYLKHHLVDAIFMDHTMPGMDGLETVVAIKSNPRTATIPVMMYTAKEGEVYVSQARALGALGVLPKQVQPGVLLEMLRKLGLVEVDAVPGGDATQPFQAMELAGADPVVPRAVRSTDEERHPHRASDKSIDTTDPDYDQQALGASVQSVIRKVLSEQHLQLRSDILSAHREFARQVAHEILARERPPPAASVVAPAGAPEGAVNATSGPRPQRLGWLLAIPILVLALLYGLSFQERATLREEAARLGTLLDERDRELEALRAARRNDLDAERAQAEDRSGALLGALEWALNQDPRVGYDEAAFDDRRAVELDALLGRLVAAGFRGTVRIESHLGEFCLAPEAGGGYRLAAPDTPLDGCALLGHPFDQSTFVEERMSASFASYLLRSPLVNESGIDVEVVALDRDASQPLEAAPASVTSAGGWNEIAARNHRVRFAILPAR